jgi:hypothetical protein
VYRSFVILGSQETQHNVIQSGATTLSIATVSITTVSIMTVSITTVSLTTVNITTLSKMIFSISINKSRHSGQQHPA